MAVAEPSAPSAAPRASRWTDPVPWFTGAALLVLWEAATRYLAVPAYVLPSPSRIAMTLVARSEVILPHALVTASEIGLGLLLGAGLGIAAALAMARLPLLERAMGPLLVVSQALPVFAIAPLLVVWLGFGLASKLAMACLIIFFPVMTALAEGLRRTDPGLLDLATLYGATPGQRLRLIQWPSALPQLGAGLRIAAAVAPIGAVVGEWVGASAGLGLLILQANARAQSDLVFACLVVLAALCLVLWVGVDRLTRRLVRWAPDAGRPLS